MIWRIWVPHVEPSSIVGSCCIGIQKSKHIFTRLLEQEWNKAFLVVLEEWDIE